MFLCDLVYACINLVLNSSVYTEIVSNLNKIILHLKSYWVLSSVLMLKLWDFFYFFFKCFSAFFSVIEGVLYWLCSFFSIFF